MSIGAHPSFSIELLAGDDSDLDRVTGPARSLQLDRFSAEAACRFGLILLSDVWLLNAKEEMGSAASARHSPPSVSDTLWW